MKSTMFMSLAIATLCAQTAFAGRIPVDHDLATKIIDVEVKIDDQVNPPGDKLKEMLLKKEDAMLTKLQAEDPDGYESLRAAMVNKAETLDIFLRWATPEEIEADAGLTDDDAFQEGLDNSSTGDDSAIKIFVHLASQKIDAHGPGLDISNHPVASARPGYVTPQGCYHPTLLQKMHYSHRYNNAPMPNSVFFKGGVALHEGPLGIRSHGCVHLSWADSATIFNAVTAAGRGNTTICVVAK